MAYGSVLGRNTKPQFVPTFAITGPFPGDTVTVSYGGTTVEAVEDNGVWYAKAWAYGTYTISVGSKSTTVNVDEVKLYEVTLITVDTTLNLNSWDIIRKVADMGQSSNYWNIGDRKAVVLNGTVGHLSLSNYTTYAFIIGIDHNASLEGANCIHFQLAKTALSGGTDVCFCDNQYGPDSGWSSPGADYFVMNANNTNSGGWVSSQMRTNICGTSLSSYSGTIIDVIPAELRAALKTVAKYTDNTGGAIPTASNVTATTDYFFLLSEYEVFGSISEANPNEESKQTQYAYYSAGNSKIKYKHNDTSTAADWWLRSPRMQDVYLFVRVHADGSVSDSSSSHSLGFTPGFCV